MVRNEVVGQAGDGLWGTEQTGHMGGEVLR